jgi:hypothetical protein
MKYNPKNPDSSASTSSRKISGAFELTAKAIGKKLLEIKRISGTEEITELNMALWRHLK